MGPHPFTIRWLPATASTNRLAMEDIDAPPWTVWLTDHQTQGRGRTSGTDRNAWHDSPGECLLMSVVVQPRVPLHALPRLTLVSGVAAAEALTKATGVQVQLKWPNDLVVERGKLGGILVESTSGGDRARAVIGMGINVNNNPAALPKAVRAGSTSLWAQTGVVWDRLALLTTVLASLRFAVEEFEARDGELGGLHGRWESIGDVAGRRIRADGSVGFALGLTPSGGLRVLWDDGSTGAVDSGMVEWDVE